MVPLLRILFLVFAVPPPKRFRLPKASRFSCPALSLKGPPGVNGKTPCVLVYVSDQTFGAVEQDFFLFFTPGSDPTSIFFYFPFSSF